MARKEDTLKLTESGAAAVRAWMLRHGVTLVALAQAAGLPHQMAASRAIKREGRLSLEQVGKLVSHAGGELTAAQLVGMDMAAAIPVVAVQPPPAPRPASAPPRATAPALPPEQPEPGAEAMDDDGIDLKSLGSEALGVLVEGMRAAAPGSSERRRHADLVRAYVSGKARQAEEKREEPQHVTDDELMRKMQLIESQWTGRSLASIEAEDRGDYEGEGLA
jgi:hypothetical protein